MLKSLLTAAAVLALAASTATAQTAPAGVSLVIRDGKVTLKAEQASLRQILAEWGRQGGVKVTGADKLVGAPVTLTIVDMPEKQALEIVMRGVPGYMAVDRVAQASAPDGPSRFDRVLIMARASTPVAATPAGSLSGSRGMPAPAQPPAFQQAMGSVDAPVSFGPPVGDEGVVAPERNDVEQFQQVEPPMPDGPVANPYPNNAAAGSPYIGASISSGPYGGNPAAAAAAGLSENPPETQFDYANPQKYFEQRRQQQLQQQQPTSVPTLSPGIGTPVGTTGRPTNAPTAMPTAPGVLAQPGVAPRPQAAPTPAQGEFFNPYNLPADWVPPPVTPDNTGTPVEPDRAKYSNPYNPQQPPE